MKDVSTSGRPGPSGWARGVAAALLLAAAGCSGGAAIEMASIDRVGPAVIEQGDVLRIEGAGFVEGPARITLSGDFDPSGLVPPEHRVVVMEGTALSETSIEVPISAPAMRSLAAEALRFRGRVSVDFPSALPSGPAHIAATSAPMTLDVRPAGSGVASAARRSREAEEALGRLGLALAASPEGNELLVGSVVSGGLADKVGIAPGDRLLAVDGVALSSPADLAGLRQDEPHRFDVVSGSGRTQSFDLRLRSLDPTAADEVTAILLTAVALGLFLSFAVPFRLSRPAGPGPIHPSGALGLAAVAVPVVALPAIAVLADVGHGAAAFLFAGAVGGLVLAAIYGAGPARRRAVLFLARLAAVLAVPALAAASGFALDVAGAVADQDGSRWGWTAWRCPFALLACLAATALAWPGAEAADSGALARAGAWTAATFTAMAIAAYGLGGWLVPWAPAGALAGDRGLLLAGTGLFAAKTWTVLAVARAFARHGVAERRRGGASLARPLLAAGALAGAFGLSLAWEWTGPPAEVGAAGRILSAGVFFALAAAFWAKLGWEHLSARRARATDELRALGSG